MARDKYPQTALRAECGVVEQNGRFVAESDEPWLSLERVDLTDWIDRYIEVMFRASLLDEPARPIFRFWLHDGAFLDRIGAAPIAGAGSWIGRVPREAASVSVSPTNRKGIFDFRIERIRPLPWCYVLARGFLCRPRAARSALLTRLIGWRPESDVNMAWAISSHPLTDYSAWQASRTRPFDGENFDRPRFDWSAASPIRVIIVGDDAVGLQRTLAALSDQIFQGWHAIVLADSSALVALDPRIDTCTVDDLYSIISRDGNRTLTCALHAGDVLLPTALAYVAEQAQRYPAHSVFFGDAVLVSVAGRTSPRLQPGWSPRLCRSTTGYPEAPVFVRDLGSWPEPDVRAFAGDGARSRIAAVHPSVVKPLRRVLLEIAERGDLTDGRLPRAEGFAKSQATAAVIILTRDQPALLRRAIASITARTRPGRCRVVVVDNGSTTSEAKALLEELTADPAIVRRDHPGGFNFSLMCNEAAAATTDDVLIFLNDDTEVISENWLERLIAHALDPSIGAVGAKMTYPDGRLQHIGVLVGMGESAGHFGALDAGDASGWAGRNKALHEVSAVTGACLAVARAKFEAVDGFDAEHLPIELSDIDLCLKLNARGWQTIVDPEVHLMHEESASRGGATFRRLDVYARQRAIFVDRWRHVLRDDPFFHPGLSLYSMQAALG